MTNADVAHPPLEHVVEDALEGMETDQLWARLEAIKGEVRELMSERARIEQVMWSRAKEARPEVETAGTAVLAGETTQVTVGATRTWDYHEKPLQALGYAEDPQGRRLLTDVEYGKLVTWVPKVDGVYYNTLLKRGGFVKEALERCRTLKSAAPTFTGKERR